MKVFISYKHEGSIKNSWVKKLVTDLIEVYGIDCLLDQFDLKPGDSIYQYMQRIKTEASTVLFIITPKTIEALENNTGGISFEAQLWTALRSEGKIKVIPILREGSQTAAYVAAHLYIDFRNEDNYNLNLKSLADTLTNKDIKPTKSIRSSEQYIMLDRREKMQFLNSLTMSSESSEVLLATALNDKDLGVRGTAIKLLKTKFVDIGSSLLEDYSPPAMIKIPAGDFIMGENDESCSFYLDDFYIDKFPVTNQEYSIFVKDANKLPPVYWTNGNVPVGLEKHPVVYISWFDAIEYAEWCGKRLPTDAEWEKAASWDPVLLRKRNFPWGQEWHPEYCNEEEQGTGDTKVIGSYSPNGDSAFGVSEMYGNIREWTSSLFKSMPYDSTDSREDLSLSGKRTVRGKSWNRLLHWGRVGVTPIKGYMQNSFYRFRCAFSNK